MKQRSKLEEVHSKYGVGLPASLFLSNEFLDTNSQRFAKFIAGAYSLA